MSIEELLLHYESGAEEIILAVRQTSPENWSKHPIPGKWSIRQVVCHLADFEPIFADRMKRVLVEENPTLFGGDPNLFAAGLHYELRDVEQELQLIQLTRLQMSRILRSTEIEAFQRTGVHSEAGPLTLETILERATRHVTHHIQFINQKAAALQTQPDP